MHIYGARLQASGEDVVFCARGEQLRALKEQGLEIKSIQGDLKLRVKATERPADFAPYDLILFAVKSYDTEAGAQQLEGCLAKDGALMTIQNGVENEEILCKFFPRDAVMGGNSRVGAEVVAPGKVLHTALGRIEFGELDGRETPRAQRVAEIFRRAGIFGELTTDLKTIRWHKLMGNNSTNSVGTLSRTTLGQMLADPDGFALVRTLMIETVIVGRRGREHERRARRSVLAGPGKESANNDDEAVDPAGPREGQAARVRRHLRRRLEGRAPSPDQGDRDRNRLHAPEIARRRKRVRPPLTRVNPATLRSAGRFEYGAPRLGTRGLKSDRFRSAPCTLPSATVRG